MLHDVTLHDVIGGFNDFQLAKTTRVSRVERVLREKYRRPNRVCVLLRPSVAHAILARFTCDEIIKSLREKYYYCYYYYDCYDYHYYYYYCYYCYYIN